MNTLANLQRRALGGITDTDHPAEAEAVEYRVVAIRRRFMIYRTFVRLGSLGCMVALAVWLAWPRR